MEKRCISLENIKGLIIFWAIVSVFMILALLVVVLIDRGFPYTIAFSLLAFLLSGFTGYLFFLFFSIKKTIATNGFQYTKGRVIDTQHGPYFGGIKLGIEFLDVNGIKQKIQTEPYFWHEKAELYIRKDFIIGYRMSNRAEQIIIMDEVR